MIITSNIFAVLVLVFTYGLMDWLQIHHPEARGAMIVSEVGYFFGSLLLLILINWLIGRGNSPKNRRLRATVTGLLAWIILLIVLALVALPIHLGLGGSL